MLTQAIAVILLVVPAIAAAECGFVAGNGEMTIVVGKDANNRCFSSPAFKDQFSANLLASVNAMEQSEAPSARSIARPPGRKVKALELPVQQAVLYYGQNPKR